MLDHQNRHLFPYFVDGRRQICNKLGTMSPDYAWFKDAIRARFGTLGALASKMTWASGTPYELPQLTKILKGERRATYHEIQQLAHFLEIPLHEILRRLKEKVPETPAEKAFRKKAEAQGLTVEELMRKVAGR